MARLEAVYAETLDKSAIEKVSRCNSKARLVADPYITVSQIQRVIENYMDHMKTNDFWTLVAPPASLAVANWQTPPNPSWLSKVLPLLYDFLEFAPNTKLQGTKVTKALYAIYLNKNLQVDTKHGKVEDALDNMSTSLRIVLSMLRQVKTNESTKAKVCRQLSREQVGKLNLVLKKVILPDECFERGYQSENDDSQEQLDLQPDIQPIADVDLTPEVPAQKTAKLFGAMPKAIAGNHQTVPVTLTISSSMSMCKLPSIFDKILSGAEASSGQAAVSQLSDKDLLAEAMQMVPEPTKQKQKQERKKSSKTTAENTQKKPEKKEQKKKVQKKKKANKGKVAKTGDAKKVKAHKSSDHSSPEDCKFPEYKVEVYPTEEDTYRNLYTSRHHNRAKALALRWGLSLEAAKQKGRIAAAAASKIWDEVKKET